MNAVSETPPLRILDPLPSHESWPEDPAAFLRRLGGPVWITVAGRDRSRHRVVTTLLHGNEPSGVRAVLAWLRSNVVPAVDTSFFLASVAAALELPGFSHRVLFGHRDLNRCFAAPFEGAEGALAHQVLERIRALEPEALVDLHNTTGDTPPYGVGPSQDRSRLALSSLFADRYVHNDLRLGALIEAVQEGLPSVVIECGRAGSAAADRVAARGLASFLALESIAPEAAGADGKRLEDITVVGSPVRVCLQPGLVLRYGDGPAEGVDLVVDVGVDRHNFHPVDRGAPFGWVRAGGPWPFVATRADGAEVSRDLLEIRDGRVCARRPFVPIMMTADAHIAVQDCIFYAADSPHGR